MNKKRVEIEIFGIVQGVGFRYFVYDLAELYNITGWVKNTLKGSVMIEAEGEEDILKEFIKKVEKGPRLARVDHIEVSWSETLKNYDYFRILH